MHIRFAIGGTIELSRQLQNVSAAVQDWTPAFSKSAEDLLEVFSYDVFETEGAALGAAWVPLSMAYAKWKESRYPGTGILTATGHMRESFTSIVDTNSLTIGNAAEYFKYHQSSAPRQRLPRRVMLMLTFNMKETVVKNFRLQLLEQVG